MLSVSSAQIPNAGFETWTSGSPTGWTTNNVTSVDTPITQSTDAHSGTYAMQGTVVVLSISRVVAYYTPITWAGFAISARYGSLKGYYKFSSIGGDSLEVAVIYFKNGTGNASGLFGTGVSVSSYTQFTVPITFVSSAAPDSAWIEILISSSSGMTHAGSTFKIDDLSFGPVTDVQESFSVKPAMFALSQNYPNPFNPSTMISYQIPNNDRVRLEIYDVMGRTLTTLVNEEKPAGQYTVPFDGSKFTSGIYFYRINVITRNGKVFSQTNKMILMK